MMRTRTWGLVALALALASSVLPSATSSAFSARVVVAGATPLPHGYSVVPTPISTSFDVVLARPDDAALHDFLSALYQPTSPLYHHFLTPREFGRRFGATTSTVSTLRRYFRGFGLHVGAPSAGRVLLHVSGLTTSIARAFNTPVETVRRANGVLSAQFASPASLPGDVANLVSGVVGLSSAAPPAAAPLAQPRTSAAPGTCSGAGNATTNAPNSLGGYTLQQQGTLYGLTKAWNDGVTGLNQTVAIFELGNYHASDVAAYASCYGLNPSISVTTVDGGGSPGGADEATLDVEEVAGLAPGAAIEIYAGPNSGTGPTDTYARIADDNTASIVTTSWGTCETDPNGSASAEQSLFEQMAAQGQTVYASSGDEGSSDCSGVTNNNLAVDDPASQPFVTGVGGLSVTSISPLSQSVWNDGQGSNGGASGGGLSTLWSRPSWQSAPGIDTSQTMRMVPDLAVMGDPSSGFIQYFSGQWGSVGGTSIGSPLLAAMTAVAAQSCAVPRLGFLNPTFYANASSGFIDVTRGSNDLFGVGGYSAGPGYDMASGLGSPNPSTFLAALCPPTAASLTAQASVSEATPTVGGTEPTITLQLSTKGGLPLANATVAISATVTSGMSLIDDDQSSRANAGNAVYSVATDANGSISFTVLASSPGPVAVSVTYQGVSVYSTTLNFVGATPTKPATPKIAKVTALTGGFRLVVAKPAGERPHSYQYSITAGKTWRRFSAVSRKVTVRHLVRHRTYRVVVRAVTAGVRSRTSRPARVTTK